MEKESIYVLEDDVNISQLIKYNLELNGYKIMLFERGEDLLKEIENSLPKLFLLDIMLPDIDGLDICKIIRKNSRTANIPIIMLTAKSEEFDKVLGLELGADDYITKPFSVRELTARVKAILRRANNASQTDLSNEPIEYKDICLYPESRKLYKNGMLINTTMKEFDLLKILMLNKGRVLSRDFLLNKIWGFDYYGETRTVDVHIRYLRQKLEDNDATPSYIETVRGIGYRFVDDDVLG